MPASRDRNRHMTLARDTVVDYLNRNIRLAEELEREGPGSEAYSRMENVYGLDSRPLSMGQNYDFIPSRDRVAGIHHDSSVVGGLEMTREGTPERFWTSYHELERIQRHFDRNGFHSGRSDSTHIHAMTAQNVLLPIEVLLNAHQLFRYYLPGILLLTGTGGGGVNGAAMNRRIGQYANPVETVTTNVPRVDVLYDPGAQRTIRERILDSIRRQTWYDANWFVAENLTAGTRHGGNKPVIKGSIASDDLRVYIQGLHIEYRINDSSSSPAHIAALREMYRALLIKAAKIYQDTGSVMHVRPESNTGTSYFDRVQQAVDDIRMADGQEDAPSPATQRFAQDNARSLLLELSEFMDPEPLAVLSSIAERPIYKRLKGRPGSHRRSSPEVWRDINSDLIQQAEVALDQKRALVARLALAVTLEEDARLDQAVKALNDSYHNAGGVGELNMDELRHMGFEFNELTSRWVNRNLELDARLCPMCRKVYRDAPALPPAMTPPIGPGGN